jgi:hypothetical protein
MAASYARSSRRDPSFHETAELYRRLRVGLRFELRLRDVAADEIRIARFRSPLDNLSEVSSSSKQEIADQTVKYQQVL